MKSLSSVSFLLLGTIVFHLFSSTAIVEAHQATPAGGWGGQDDPYHGMNPNVKKFCVPKAGVGDAELQKNLDWACGQGIDCGPIQPGAACAEPATVKSRATFAMNSYYRLKGGVDSACDFSGTGQTTTTNPSYGNCGYV